MKRAKERRSREVWHAREEARRGSLRTGSSERSDLTTSILALESHLGILHKREHAESAVCRPKRDEGCKSRLLCQLVSAIFFVVSRESKARNLDAIGAGLESRPSSYPDCPAKSEMYETLQVNTLKEVARRNSRVPLVPFSCSRRTREKSVKEECVVVKQTMSMQGERV